MSVHVGDVGTKIKIDVQSNISNATLLRIAYSKPDGATGQWIAFLDSNTSVGYLLQAGDIDQPGIWKLQPYIESPTWKGHGESVEFTVLKNIGS